MTLTKGIEAAREALKLIMRASKPEKKIYILAGNALDALPDKPMTVEKIMEIMIQTVINEGGNPSTDAIMSWMRMLKFLKSANLLYVQE